MPTRLWRTPEGVAIGSLEERIIALSKAHDVLLQQSFVSARICEVVGKAMSIHDYEAQITRRGPNVTLGPKATLSLTMLLHEMATNAIKYGALSVEAGRVDIVWRIDRSGQEPMLVLGWTERGGPPARAPERRGFGSRLIGMGLAGAGAAKLVYEEAGLKGEFRASLRAVEEN